MICSVQKIKDDEEQGGKNSPSGSLAALKKYTEEMKHNLEHFSEIMDEW